VQVESLLNACWLLLMVPAVALWLRKRHYCKSMQLAIVLVCLLVLLFPVISATDDLRAMRQEAEESSLGKPKLHPSNSSSGQGAIVPAQLNAIFQFALPNHVFSHVQIFSLVTHRTVCTAPSPGRAPPSFLLS